MTDPNYPGQNQPAQPGAVPPAGSVPPAPSYSAPPQNQGGEPPLNTLALVSFIGSFFISLVGIICGHIALSQIKKTGERGRGFALAGLIIGYVAIAITIIAIIAAVMGAIALSSYDTELPTY